jgi:hypothetical protein
MPSVLETPETEVRKYQEVALETPAAPRSRSSHNLASLRAMLRSGRVSDTICTDQFETSIDRLTRKQPYIFIWSYCG